MSYKLENKSHTEYSWKDNVLHIGEISVGSVQMLDDKWIGVDVLNPKFKTDFETRGKAIHWVTEQMLNWLAKAGITK